MSESPSIGQSIDKIPINAMQIYNDESQRYCWICFATDEEDLNAIWVRPCLCKGTLKWVHEKCLKRWVDEKQKGNPSTPVLCPQCGATYVIVYPDMGFLTVLLDEVNAFVYRVCPFMAAGVVLGSIYWVAVSYGAVTVMQVMGVDEGVDLMESTDPLMLLVGLPCIPIGLILGKMVKWEDTALFFLRRNARKVPVLKYILPCFIWFSAETEGGNTDVPIMTDPVSATRILCSALVFPTIATIIGNLLFRSFKTNLQRTFLGGITFLTVKGILTLYHKQQSYIRQMRRRIQVQSEEDGSADSPTTSHPSNSANSNAASVYRVLL